MSRYRVNNIRQRSGLTHSAPPVTPAVDSARGAEAGLSVLSRSKPRPSGRGIRGLTLIELLLVVGMCAVIGMASYGTLRNGLTIWQRTLQPLPNEDLVIAFDKFNQDARNSFSFSGLTFVGEPANVEFITLVNSPQLKAKTVGKVAYSFDEGQSALRRSQRDFSQIYLGQEGRSVILLREVKRMRCEYYFFDKVKNAYVWVPRWEENGIPLALRMTLEVSNGKDYFEISKTVSIPASG